MSIPSVVSNGCSLHQSPKSPLSLFWLHEGEDIEERNSKVKTCVCFSNNIGEVGGWSFLQALPNPSHSQKLLAESEKVYVHPLAKRSVSTMHTKSLKMCTESLGSETGSDNYESSMDEGSAASFLLEKQNYEPISKSRLKKMNGKGNFPPPLTSISRAKGVQVRLFREDGRLVIKAVNITTPTSYFHTERSNGRLTLSLRKPENKMTKMGDDEGE